MRENWDFKARQMTKQGFFVIFPDKQSLDTFTKLSSFELTLFGLKTTLEKIETDP